MKIPAPSARLVGGKSEERDVFGLVNQIRDQVVNKEVNAWSQIITTTDATLTSVWNDQLPANSIGNFWFTAVAQSADATKAAGYMRRVAVQRVGTAGLVYLGAGADVIGVDKETDAGWDAGFALDATAPGYLYIAVTGAVGVSVMWRVHVIGTVQPWV